MTKRILAVLLAVLLCSAVFTYGCETATEQKTDETEKDVDPESGESDKEPDEPTPDPVPMKYADPLSFTGALTVSCTDWTSFYLEKTWNYSDEAFIGANDTFNKDLAMNALYMILAISNGIFTLDGQTVDLYETMGLTDVKCVDLAQMGYTIDVNDVTVVTLAQKTFTTADGTSYQLITAVIKPGYGEDGWHSNFDVGADTEEYIDANGGESPDWIDKKEHKGFSVTAERVAQLIEKYIDTYGAEAAQPIVFVTGQSRGGAVANLTAKHLIDRGQKAVSYGFNVPNTTTENDEKILSSYTTIYNVINAEDVVSDVPLSAWGFTRCGQDITYSIAADPTAWEALFGTTYVYLDTELTNTVLSLLTGIADSREALYVFDESAETLALQCLGAYDPATQAADIEKATHPAALGDDALRSIKFITEDVEGGQAVYYAIRPSFVTIPLADAVFAMLSGGNSTTLMLAVYPYLTYLSAYTSMLSGIVSTVQSDTALTDRFLYSHVVYTDFIGVDMIAQ